MTVLLFVLPDNGPFKTLADSDVSAKKFVEVLQKNKKSLDIIGLGLYFIRIIRTGGYERMRRVRRFVCPFQ